MHKEKLKWCFLFLIPVVAMFCFLYAVPLFKVLSTSLFEYKLTVKGMRFIGFKNYVDLFTQDTVFRVAMKNTVIWILLHTFLHVALGVFLALVLNRKPRGWQFVRTVYMSPNIIAASAMALIWRIIYNPDWGIINSFLRAIGLRSLAQNWLFGQNTAFGAVTMIWFIYAGYTTTLVLARLLSIPSDLKEAALIDGCTPIQVDFRVLLPIAKDTISTTMIMAASYMLTMFPLIYMTTGGGPGNKTYNLSLFLYQKAMIENNYGYANAVGVVVIIMGMICMHLIKWLMGERGDRRE